VFDPGAAFTVGPNTVKGSWIGQIDRCALTRSVGLVAFLPKGVRSVGVPMEIMQAASMGMPVAVVTDEDTSWALASLTGKRVKTYPMTREGTFRAVAHIAEHDGWQEEKRPYRELLGVQLGEGAKLPTRRYDGDAGFDLYVVGGHTIPPHSFVDVPCNIQLDLPSSIWGLITGRSSTIRDRGLMVMQGVIDNGYKGDLFTAVWNLTDDDVVVNDGERLAQLIPFHLNANDLVAVPVEDVGTSERGWQGFGSTGV
jgi:dUTP pyrophosphatase